MALSRIWSAFIIISVVVACYHWLGLGNEVIFNRMVVGGSGDTYPYVAVGGDTSAKARSSFATMVKPWGFVKKDSLKDVRYIITDDPNADTVKKIKAIVPDASVYTYNYVRTIGMRPTDGI